MTLPLNPTRRQVIPIFDHQAQKEVYALLGTPTPQQPWLRDTLIERLHQLNDHWGALYHRHLRVLADAMKCPVVEVLEVASFYHHFTVLPDDAPPLPRLHVRVCTSQSCAMQGANTLLHQMQTQLGLLAPQPDVYLTSAPCIGRCDHAPAAWVHRETIDHATSERLLQAIAQAQKQLTSTSSSSSSLSPPPPPPPPLSIFVPSFYEIKNENNHNNEHKNENENEHKNKDKKEDTTFEAYCAAGGYTLWQTIRKNPPHELLPFWIEQLEAAQHRGLGGAGFLAARKWQAVAKQPSPRYLVINADEGEPGTFKDRYFLEHDPHRVIEGALIAAHVVGATCIGFYIRDEYTQARRIFQQALDAWRTLTQTLSDDPPPPQWIVRRGAGAYICGEESALIESLEGKRGEPRLRPPYVAEHGLLGHPTLAHNVETLYWLRSIGEQGGSMFLQQGILGRGMRTFSLSGRVRSPGVKHAPAGISVADLIEQYGGGMQEGHQLYAYLPGGASGGILPASLAHLPLDFGTLQPYGGLIGSAAVIVLSQMDSAKEAAQNTMTFFAHESCGQCTPCREGTYQAVQLMQASVWDESQLIALCDVMENASICGLGQAAPNGVRCVMRYFRDEVGLI